MVYMKVNCRFPNILKNTIDIISRRGGIFEAIPVSKNYPHRKSMILSSEV